MKKIIATMLIISMCFIPTLSYSAFYDLEYPPNNTGRADYSDEDAEAQKEEQQSVDPDEYIGKSSNNFLKTLKVENAKLEPKFNRQYVDYNVKLEDENTKKINIIADPEDENAKIEGIGEVELQDGINNLRVVVTAENGNVQIYNLVVELPYEQSSLVLDDLQIYGINIQTGEKESEKLKPSFSPQEYKYNIKVINEITSLYIETKEKDGCAVEIKGAEDLQVGENKVFIKVINNEDESEITTYVINVERQEEKKNNKILVYIGGIILLVIISVIIRTNKKNKKN